MFENNQIRESFKAGVALTAHQYHVVRVTSGTADTVYPASATTQVDIVGVLQNNPEAVGREATVAVIGMTRLVCGSAVSVGDQLTTSASGRAVRANPASGTGVTVIGKALAAAAADGDIITAWINTPYKFIG